MPATWGFGAAGTEPITMAGWGYLADLAGTVIDSAIYSATEIRPTYRAREIESAYSDKEIKTSYRGRTDEERN